MEETRCLGPVFESSQAVLSVIATLPPSVTHLDLDLRNALHLVPRAMPLLFSKQHIETLRKKNANHGEGNKEGKEKDKQRETKSACDNDNSAIIFGTAQQPLMGQTLDACEATRHLPRLTV
jgi:hypothetical protein